MILLTSFGIISRSPTTRRRRLKRAAMAKLDYERVFGIGDPKTATTSLRAAFEILGFKHKGWDPRLWHSWEQRRFEEIFAVAARFESFEDGPWNAPSFFEALDRRFPRSKFVLTVRDTEAWIRSHEHHFSADGATRIPPELRIGDYGRKRVDIVATHEERDRDVSAYFASRPDDLLILDICAGEGWEKLCPFLGLPVPEREFPHENRSTSGRLR